MEVAEARFRVMGVGAHLLVVGGGDDLVGRGRARLEALEACWSRFRPESEVSRLNDSAGRPVAVSADTYLLVERAVDAWRATAGRFDPTILDALVRAGYDRSFEQLASVGPTGTRPGAAPVPRTAGAAPGCRGVVLDPVVGSVSLPRGVAFDPGGIGKGLAADLVTEELLGLGAAGACVNLGGDLRVAGEAPSSDGWVIGIEHPWDPDRRLGVLQLLAGAVVTTTPRFRTWMQGGRPRHHLVDPATGEPAETGVAAVTVVAGEAWWAEVVAKAAYLAGVADAPAVLHALGTTGVIVTSEGRVDHAVGIEAYLA